MATSSASTQAVVFDPASLLCGAALPTTRLFTSGDAGWTSALLEMHDCQPHAAAFETHPTSDLTIVVARKGMKHLESHGRGRWRKATTRMGSVGMTPGGETSRLRWASDPTSAPIETAHLYIPQAIMAGAFDEHRRLGAPLPDVPLSVLCYDDPVIATVVSALIAGARCGAPDLFASSLVHGLAVHLLFRHSKAFVTGDDVRRPGPVSEARMARVLEYMQAHRAEPLTLETLAREAEVSRFHVSRMFRERMGVTPHAHLMTLRLEAARDLLVRTDRRIDDIGAACGYARATHFSTAFKQRFGVSPRAYRRLQLT